MRRDSSVRSESKGTWIRVVLAAMGAVLKTPRSPLGPVTGVVGCGLGYWYWGVLGYWGSGQSFVLCVRCCGLGYWGSGQSIKGPMGGRQSGYPRPICARGPQGPDRGHARATSEADVKPLVVGYT